MILGPRIWREDNVTSYSGTHCSLVLLDVVDRFTDVSASAFGFEVTSGVALAVVGSSQLA